MINPVNSPWNKSKSLYIRDQKLWARWSAIKKHLTTTPNVVERNGYLEINSLFYIAKNSSKMRLISNLDWSHYTSKTLAQAIDTNTVESYYETMLKDSRSDPNVWKDTDKEMELKTYYAFKKGRAKLIKPPEI
jgi:hypothetical protein